MTLHDRIMALKNDTNECGDEQDYFECAAYNAGLEQGAKLAKEADELMALLAEDLRDQCTNPNDYTDSLLSRYKTYMEGKQ